MSETQNVPQHSAPDPATGATVLLVADLGLPTHRARSIEDSLQQHLDEMYHPPIRLDVLTSMLRLRPDGTLDLSEVLEQARSSGDPDAVLLYVCLVVLIFTGALGSSFDKGTDMRSLTHGQRERQRVFTEEEEK